MERRGTFFTPNQRKDDTAEKQLDEIEKTNDLLGEIRDIVNKGGFGVQLITV